MTDAPPDPAGALPLPAGGGHGGSTLGLRLALAFLGVTLAAVALIALLTAVFSAADVSSLAGCQRDQVAGALAVTASSAWQRDNSWDGADLTTTFDLGAHFGVQLQVRDAAGRAVRATSGFASATGTSSSAPVLVKGQEEGSVLVRLTSSGLGAADGVLRTALLRAIAGTAGLAALLTLLTGLVLARRITRPVARLIAVTRAMAGGDRSARAARSGRRTNYASLPPPSTRWPTPSTVRTRSAGTPSRERRPRAAHADRRPAGRARGPARRHHRAESG